MATIDNVLKFIELEGISKRKFEAETNLPNGTLGKAVSRNADLSEDVIGKIVDKYSTLLKKRGFAIIDMKAYGKTGYSIIKSSDTPLPEPPRETPRANTETTSETMQDEYKEKYIKLLERQLETSNKVVELRLTALEENQAYLRAYLVAVAKRDAQRFVGSESEDQKSVEEMSKIDKIYAHEVAGMQAGKIVGGSQGKG